MVGNRRPLLLLGMFLASATSVSAFGGRSARPSNAMAYAPVPVYCPPVVTWPAPAYVIPAPPPPMAMPRALAQPLPAPPSGSAPPTSAAEPPLNTPKAPKITESRTFGGIDPALSAQVAPGLCRVGFWNITGQDVTLTVDGKARTLPKDRALTLQINRSFVWQVEGRAPQTERVPQEKNDYEVILRP